MNENIDLDHQYDWMDKKSKKDSGNSKNDEENGGNSHTKKTNKNDSVIQNHSTQISSPAKKR